MDIKTAIEELRAEVQANGDATASAAALISGLADRILAANHDDNVDNAAEDIDALANELKAQSAALAAAVTSGSATSTSTTAQTQSSGGTGNGPGPSTAEAAPAIPPGA